MNTNVLPKGRFQEQIPDRSLECVLRYHENTVDIRAETQEKGWDILTYAIRTNYSVGGIVGYGCYVIDPDNDLILAEERDTLLIEAVAKALLIAQIKPIRAEDV